MAAPVASAAAAARAGAHISGVAGTGHDGSAGPGGFGGGNGPGGGAGLGGAIFSEQGSVTIINSTLAGNSVTGGSGGPGGGGGSGFGGAVFIANGTLTISDSTLFDNTVTAGGGSPTGAVGGRDVYNLVADPFAGLTTQERFVQALYLDVLGRAGSTAELDSWVVLFNEDRARGTGRPPSPRALRQAWRGATIWSRTGTKPTWAGRRPAARNWAG